MKIREIPLEAIQGSAYQPRRQTDREIARLARSIRRNGLRIPVVLREKKDGGYEILCGHRRLAALERLRKAGVASLPAGEARLGKDGGSVNALVFDLEGEKEAVLTGFLDNYERCDLSPFEQAACFREFVRKQGFTQAELSRRVGIGQTALGYMLATLDTENLPADMIASWKEKRLTLGHMICLLRLRAHPERQRELYQMILEKRFQVREAESLCAQALANPGRVLKDQRHERIEKAFHESAELTKFLDRKWLKLGRTPRGEKIELEYRSLDEFQLVLRELFKVAKALEGEEPAPAPTPTPSPGPSPARQKAAPAPRGRKGGTVGAGAEKDKIQK